MSRPSAQTAAIRSIPCLTGAVALLWLGLPGAALAQGASDGSVAGAGGATAPAEAPAQPQSHAPTPGEAVVSGIPTPVRMIAANGGSVTFSTRSAGIVGQSLSFSGDAPSRDSGQRVTLERLDASGGSWSGLAHSRVGAGGAFTLGWKADVAGRFSLRAVVGPSTGAPDAGAALAQSSGSAQVTIYHRGVATYYGPGFYGQRTACGQLLTREVVGVANRTLPCGTLVAVSYGSQTLVVPVIDRGPYRHGVSWDLTYHAAKLLGAEGMEPVGTMIVGSTANTPLLGEVPGPHGSPTGGSEAAPAAG